MKEIISLFERYNDDLNDELSDLIIDFEFTFIFKLRNELKTELRIIVATIDNEIDDSINIDGSYDIIIKIWNEYNLTIKETELDIQDFLL